MDATSGAGAEGGDEAGSGAWVDAADPPFVGGIGVARRRIMNPAKTKKAAASAAKLARRSRDAIGDTGAWSSLSDTEILDICE
jgi:hypothetical protein